MEIATVPGMGLRQVEVKPIMYMDIDTDSNNVLSNFDTKLSSHSHLMLQIPQAKEPVGGIGILGASLSLSSAQYLERKNINIYKNILPKTVIFLKPSELIPPSKPALEFPDFPPNVTY